MLNSHDIDIPKATPFENAIAGRSETAEALTTFIKAADTPTVMCVDAPWGQGKSTFLRMWRQHLINQEFATIYYNAWDFDFCEDAMLSLMGELSSAFSDNGNSGLLDNTIALGSKIVKHTLPLGARLLSGGLVNWDNDAEDALSQYAEEFVKQRVKEYGSAKATVAEFRESLAKFAESVSVEGKPLVIFIDELDRCRPNFAIEVLEKAKHFFNVGGVFFVLGVDKAQLGSSFRAVYGEGLDVKGYLRRFIDVDFLLPKADRGGFFDLQCKAVGLSETELYRTGSTASEIKEILGQCAYIHQLSLRDIRQCLSLLNYIFRSTSETGPRELCLPLLIYMIVLKIARPEDYLHLITREISAKEHIEFIVSAGKDNNSFSEQSWVMVLEIALQLVEGGSDAFSRLHKHYTKLEQTPDTEPAADHKRFMANRKLAILRDSHIRDFECQPHFNWLVGRIELATHFRR